MIVLGLGFGDEGKGLVTSFLCANTKNPLVVRFNGGHQAGHTVVHDGLRHVFSSFGSGTLQGVPTYWSRFCTFYPTAFLNEHRILPVKPQVYVDPLCPVTTPYDVEFNKNNAEALNNGTVGVGFGYTVKRHEEGRFRIYVQDLYHEKVLRAKLDLISRQYYKMKVNIESFMEDVEKVKNLILNSRTLNMDNYNLIFEGAQGILLDQDFGFFPNVTRSHTTSRNALEIKPDCEDIYYVTRSYQTRHGNGFMTNEDPNFKLKNAEQETNVLDPYQGVFRRGNLDPELMNYALQCDRNYSKELRKNLVITCMDQLEIDVEKLLSEFDTQFHKVYISTGNTYKDITLAYQNTQKNGN